MPLNGQQIEARATALQSAFVEAARRDEWTWIADAFYAEDCEYLCEYGGTMRVLAHGREEIRATHYGRDMRVGWEGWRRGADTVLAKQWVREAPRGPSPAPTSLRSGTVAMAPIERFATRGNQIITHWWNRGPGQRADGSWFQTPGVSFITVGDDGLFTYQLDLFDLAHQMLLCDELEDAGLLSPKLKELWVIPTKRRLMAMLSRNLPAE